MSRIGGWAGIGAAITYLVGFALAGTLLADTVDMAAADYVAFLADNEAIMYVWSTIIYIINGALLAALVVAVSARLAPRTPDAARIAGAHRPHLGRTGHRGGHGPTHEPDRRGRPACE